MCPNSHPLTILYLIYFSDTLGYLKPDYLISNLVQLETTPSNNTMLRSTNDPKITQSLAYH